MLFCLPQFHACYNLACRQHNTTKCQSVFIKGQTRRLIWERWCETHQHRMMKMQKKMQKTKNCDEMLEWWIKGLVVQILALGRHYLLRTRGDSRPPAARLNDSWQYFSLERFLAHFLCSAINRFSKGFASHSLPSSSVVHAKQLKVFIVPCHLPLIIHGFHHFPLLLPFGFVRSMLHIFK